MPKQAEQIMDSMAPTVFADGVSAIMTVGSVTHLIFTSREPNVMEPGKVYRTVQVRVIVPADRVQEIGRVLLRGDLVPHEPEIEGHYPEIQMH